MNKYANNIEFILDGKILSLSFDDKSELSPTTTLLKYLRTLPSHKGTKEGCAEGDCGACTVVLVGLNSDNKLEYKAVNSCLVFMPMVQGKQVITIENVENNGVLHPIQSAFVNHHASQCGFCTPGFVMSTFSLYKSGEEIGNKDIKDALAGNLCRCTGYRPIFDAAKDVLQNIKPDSFAHNEDLIINDLKAIEGRNRGRFILTDRQKYFQPITLQQAIDYKENNNDALIICGATDTALRITKRGELIPNIIDISAIKDLQFVENNDNSLFIGSCVNLNKVREIVKNEFDALTDILDVFGSKQIRNLAALGGNIGSASPIGDTLPVLMAYGATIALVSVNEIRELLLSDFIVDYRKTQLKENEIIYGIRLPKQDKSIIVKSYKVSKRKDLDISTVSGGFNLVMDNEIIKSIELYFGGMAAKTKRAIKTESFLIGKKWDYETVFEASKILKSEFQPLSDARADAEGRKLMASNLLLKFWNDTVNI